MRKLKLFVTITMTLMMTSIVSAQTVDEIIDTYIENIGGKANWEKLEALKFTGTLDFGSMQLPVTMIQTKDGLTMLSADIQGQVFYQSVFDGETLWSTNQQTFAAEKRDAEATSNHKLSLMDFPDPFLNYKSKGYKVELLGIETIEGTDVFKIKLEKKPKMNNGVEMPNVEYYYFEKENFVPILVEKQLEMGPNGLMDGQSKMSDYQEVEGLFFPFSIIDGTKEMPNVQSVTITKIEINPDIDKDAFKFPTKN